MFFELHKYIENIKAKIGIFSLKGKEVIWWEDVEWVRDIRTKDLSSMNSREFSGINTCLKGTMIAKSRNSMS